MAKSYSIKIEDNLITIRTNGKQSVDSVLGMRSDIESALAKGSKDVLIVTTGVGTPDTPVIEESVKSLAQVPLRRLAIAGDMPQRLDSATAVARSADDNERVKVFRLEEDARAWLEE